MKRIIFLCVFALASCGEIEKEVIKGGGDDGCRDDRCIPNTINGKPVRDYYKQFKFEEKLGGFAYLQSVRQEYRSVPLQGWSVDIALDFSNKIIYGFRVVNWKKDTDGIWKVASYQRETESSWNIQNKFLMIPPVGIITPHVDGNKEMVRFVFAQNFPIKDLAGKEVQLLYELTTRPF